MRRLLPKLHASTDRCLPVGKRLVKVSKEQEGLVVDTSLPRMCQRGVHAEGGLNL